MQLRAFQATQGSTLRRKRLSVQHAATPDAEEPVGGGKLKTHPHKEPVNSATHERSTIIHEPPVAESADDEHAAAGGLD
jgi:hypothetical protein